MQLTNQTALFVHYFFKNRTNQKRQENITSTNIFKKNTNYTLKYAAFLSYIVIILLIIGPKIKSKLKIDDDISLKIDISCVGES